MTILVFAGTRNGRELIQSLAERGYRVIASSAGEYGASLLPHRENILSLSGKKGSEDILDIIERERVDAVIDSTHPYACEISGNIKKASGCVPLLRYERPLSLPLNKGIRFSSMEGVLEYLRNRKGNILFTTGVNSVREIAEALPGLRAFIRILPVKESLLKASQSGLKSEQFLTMTPPFSLEENLRQIEEYHIRYLVTKDSGPEGNSSDKLRAAEISGTELLIINRPDISWSRVSYTQEEVLAFLKELSDP